MSSLSQRLIAMTEGPKVNLNHVEAAAAMLVRYIADHESGDDEIHGEMVLDTGIFGALEELNDQTAKEIARVIRRQVRAERIRTITPAEVVDYANSLPQRLRKKTFAAFVLFVVGLHGEDLGTEYYNTFEDVRKLLNISKELADQVIRVARITARSII
jgi:hypothetical protein